MADTTELINKAKTALRVTTTAYDSDISDLIDSAQLDLGIAGVVVPETLDALVERAIITYVKVHYSDDASYSRLKASYDEQKSQLMTATGYTDWGVVS